MWLGSWAAEWLLRNCRPGWWARWGPLIPPGGRSKLMKQGTRGDLPRSAPPVPSADKAGHGATGQGAVPGPPSQSRPGGGVLKRWPMAGSACSLTRC